LCTAGMLLSCLLLSTFVCAFDLVVRLYADDKQMINDFVYLLWCAVESVLFVARCSEDGDECGSPRC
jgi:hypothetical protein